MKKEEDLEVYLREFRPRAVRPLILPRPAASVWAKPLAAVAIVLAAAGVGLWLIPGGAEIAPPTTFSSAEAPVVSTPERLTSFALTKLALEDDKQFQSTLAAESRTVLPSFRNSNSALRVFAKE